MENHQPDRPKVYNFGHHSDYLRAIFSYKKKIKKTYSYVFCATRLKISVSYLKNVVSRKHPLSLDLVSSFAKFLNLPDAEIRYLTLLVVRDQVEDQFTRHYFNNILDSLKTQAIHGFDASFHSTLTENTVVLENEFLHLIYALVPLRDFKADPAWMKSVLSDPSLTEHEIKSLFDQLLKEGFVGLKDGRYHFTNRSFHVASAFDPNSYAIYRTALRQIDRSLEDERYRPKGHYMFNFTVSAEDAEKIFAIQSDCMRRIYEIADKSEKNSTRVLAISNNLITVAATDRTEN